MPFAIVREDITKMKVDAIVNSTDAELSMSSADSAAISIAAGAWRLKDACRKLAPVKIGEAAITPGFKLPAKHVIHAACPKYVDGKSGEEELLILAYLNSLKLAVDNSCQSVALSLLSSEYPKNEALRATAAVIGSFLSNHDIYVALAVLDKEAFNVSKELLDEVGSYISGHYVENRLVFRCALLNVERSFPGLADEDPCVQTLSSLAPRRSSNLEESVCKLDEPFTIKLLRLIDSKGKSDVEVYKKANIDLGQFSKIRSNLSYMPSKRTAVALALALELSIEETGGLLERAGYSLSRSQKFDVIVEYFISNGKYDIFEINQVLFQYDLSLLDGA
ncbi:MAG: macro domain-containing protein [Clostridiales bacterium]|jgi:O-acetyl-ADP-ribose deacetylase (regulator of RNase III)|nr:macro domain-containing protein [Clostridiales bacterium]